MRWLLTIFLLSLLIPTLDNVPGGASLKYVFTLGMAFLFPLGLKKVMVFPNRRVENTLFVLMIAGGIFAEILRPIPGSMLYIVVMPLSYCIYNYIRTYKLSRQQVLIVACAIFLLALPPRYFNSQGSLMGMYGNPNVLAPIVTFGFYLILTIRKQLPTIITLLFFALATVLIYKTHSRAGQAAYLIFVVGFFVQEKILGKNLKILALAGVMAALSLYYTTITTGSLVYIELANSALQSTKTVDFSERDKLFALFIEEVQTNPAGIGFGQSQKFTRIHFRNAFSPHNLYLKTAVEGGWFFAAGAALLFCFLFLTNQSALTTSFMVAICLRGLFESSTPFTLGMTSALLFLPFYLNEHSILPRKTITADQSGQPSLHQVGPGAG